MHSALSAQLSIANHLLLCRIIESADTDLTENNAMGQIFCPVEFKRSVECYLSI